MFIQIRKITTLVVIDSYNINTKKDETNLYAVRPLLHEYKNGLDNYITNAVQKSNHFIAGKEIVVFL